MAFGLYAQPREAVQGENPRFVPHSLDSLAKRKAFTFLLKFSTLFSSMSYDKKLIDKLYEQFLADQKDDDLWLLIQALEPIIEWRLGQYSYSKNVREDFVTDIKIKIFKNLRNPSYKKKIYLKRQLQNPAGYLIFLIRKYISGSVAHYENTVGRETLYGSNTGEAILLNKMQNIFMDPEKIYLARYEIPREFFKACRNDIVNDKSLESFPNMKAAKIAKIKTMIESSLGVEIRE